MCLTCMALLEHDSALDAAGCLAAPAARLNPNIEIKPALNTLPLQKERGPDQGQVRVEGVHS
jgi:hypothetical protein